MYPLAVQGTQEEETKKVEVVQEADGQVNGRRTSRRAAAIDAQWKIVNMLDQ